MLQITPNSRPAFQPDMIEDRIRELREIAKPIVQHYQSDLGHDENALREHPHVKEWLWVPYPNGTHIASLNPRGKNWARAILEHCQSAYRETPTPYLITPQGVTATTWERVRALVERLTDPTYEVTTLEGGDAHHRPGLVPRAAHPRVPPRRRHPPRNQSTTRT